MQRAITFQITEHQLSWYCQSLVTLLIACV